MELFTPFVNSWLIQTMPAWLFLFHGHAQETKKRVSDAESAHQIAKFMKNASKKR